MEITQSKHIEENIMEEIPDKIKLVLEKPRMILKSFFISKETSLISHEQEFEFNEENDGIAKEKEFLEYIANKKKEELKLNNAKFFIIEKLLPQEESIYAELQEPSIKNGTIKKRFALKHFIPSGWIQASATTLL
jgi:hypothetical protein